MQKIAIGGPGIGGTAQPVFNAMLNGKARNPAPRTPPAWGTPFDRWLWTSSGLMRKTPGTNKYVMTPNAGQHPEGLAGAARDGFMNTVATPAAAAYSAMSRDPKYLQMAGRGALSPINHVLGTDWGWDWNTKADPAEFGPGEPGYGTDIDAGVNTTRKLFGPTIDPLTNSNKMSATDAGASYHNEQARNPALSWWRRLLHRGAGAALNYGDDVVYNAYLMRKPTVGGFQQAAAVSQALPNLLDTNAPAHRSNKLLGLGSDVVNGYMAPFTMNPAFPVMDQAIRESPLGKPYFDMVGRIRQNSQYAEGVPEWKRRLGGFSADVLENGPALLAAGAPAAAAGKSTLKSLATGTGMYTALSGAPSLLQQQGGNSFMQSLLKQREKLSPADQMRFDTAQLQFERILTDAYNGVAIRPEVLDKLDTSVLLPEQQMELNAIMPGMQQPPKVNVQMSKAAPPTTTGPVGVPPVPQVPPLSQQSPIIPPLPAPAAPAAPKVAPPAQPAAPAAPASPPQKIDTTLRKTMPTPATPIDMTLKKTMPTGTISATTGEPTQFPPLQQQPPQQQPQPAVPEDNPLSQAFSQIKDMVQKYPEQAAEWTDKAKSQLKSKLAPTPEAAAQIADIIRTGEIPESMQQVGVKALVESGHPLQQAWQTFQSLDPAQRLILSAGVGVGVLGLLNAVVGSGGLGSWLISLLGLGAAAYTGYNAGWFGGGQAPAPGGANPQAAAGGPSPNAATASALSGVDIESLAKQILPVLANESPESLPAVTNLIRTLAPDKAKQLDRLYSFTPDVVEKYTGVRGSTLKNQLGLTTPEQQRAFSAAWTQK